jgi:hypothetical protein
MMDIVIRRGPIPSDRAFILDSWSKQVLGQCREHPRGVGPLATMDRDEFFQQQQGLIERVLDYPSTTLLVAHWPGEEEHILGYVCGWRDERVLHFIFTSNAVEGLYRRENIATRLMRQLFGEPFPGGRISITCWTRLVPAYREKWRLDYNPFLLFGVA